MAPVMRNVVHTGAAVRMTLPERDDEQVGPVGVRSAFEHESPGVAVSEGSEGRA
jgi:hypothetical protein